MNVFVLWQIKANIPYTILWAFLVGEMILNEDDRLLWQS